MGKPSPRAKEYLALVHLSTRQVEDLLQNELQINRRPKIWSAQTKKLNYDAMLSAYAACEHARSESRDGS